MRSTFPSFLAITFLLALTLQSSTAQTALVGPEVLAAGGNLLTSPIVADFDHDGLPDLAAIDYQGEKLRLLIWLNRSGSYVLAGTYDLNGGAVNLTQADVNGDGIPDIVAANGWNPGSVEVFISSGNGTFTRTALLATYGSPRVALVADFTGDGRADIVATNQLYVGHGDGTFDAGRSISTEVGQPLGTADLNGDGRPDVVLTNYSSFLALLNNGDGTFRNAYQVTWPVLTMAIADFTGDGNSDLATAGFSGGDLMLWVGNGNGRFQEPVVISQNSNSGPIAADLNGDGIPDIAYVTHGRALVHLNDGHGNFTYAYDLDAGEDTQGFGIGDYTGDGHDDGVFSTSSGKLLGFVAKPVGATALQLSAQTLFQSQQLTMTATVTAKQGAPTGTIKFEEGATVLATVPLTGGAAKFTTSQLTTGPHRLAAVYSGDSAFAGSYALANVTITSCSASLGTLKICSPVSGSTQASPVTVYAVGGSSVTWMELWEGGVKRYQTSGKSLTSSLNLTSGTHTLTVYGKAGSVVSDKKTATITVGSGAGGACTPPAVATAAIVCSPTEGASVSSSVAISAKGGSAVSLMELWVDGVKKTQVNGKILSSTLSLPVGTHRLTVYTKSGGVVTDKKVVNFTVRF